MPASRWETDKEGSRSSKPTPEGGAGSSAMPDVIWKLAHLEQPLVQKRAQSSGKFIFVPSRFRKVCPRVVPQGPVIIDECVSVQCVSVKC